MERLLYFITICVMFERTTLIDGLSDKTRHIVRTVRQRSISIPEGVVTCNCIDSRLQIEKLKVECEELIKENEKLKRGSQFFEECDTCADGFVCNANWNGSSCVRPTECSDVRYINDGVYYIYPNGHPVRVNCVYKHGKIWTVFQRRTDGSVNFDRNWTEYRAGFGDPHGEFWLGNYILHTLTRYSNGPHRLRIELTNNLGWKLYAAYSHIEVGSEANKFALKVAGYSGDAGDRLNRLRDNNGEMFSTPDNDNDGDIRRNRAGEEHGGWWYGGYEKVNLNIYPPSWETGMTLDIKETSLMMLTRSLPYE